jgi:hypothetical protein
VRKRTSAPSPNGWLTVLQFCDLVGICEATYHNMKRRGLGPEETWVGKMVRITPAAVDEWRERLHEEQTTKAARLEAERRRNLASVAGKLSAASPLHVSRRDREDEAVV